MDEGDSIHIPANIEALFWEPLAKYSDRRTLDEVPEGVYEKVEMLASINATIPEIAGAIGISKTKLEYLKNESSPLYDPKVVAAYERGRAKFAIFNRALQMEVAKRGDSKMLIFKGKSELGQRESVEIAGSAEAPVRVASSDIIREMSERLMGLR